MEITERTMLGVVVDNGQPFVVLVPFPTADESNPIFDLNQVIKVVVSNNLLRLREDGRQLSVELAKRVNSSTPMEKMVRAAMSAVRQMRNAPYIVQLRGQQTA